LMMAKLLKLYPDRSLKMMFCQNFTNTKISAHSNGSLICTTSIRKIDLLQRLSSTTRFSSWIGLIYSSKSKGSPTHSQSTNSESRSLTSNWISKNSGHQTKSLTIQETLVMTRSWRKTINISKRNRKS